MSAFLNGGVLERPTDYLPSKLRSSRNVRSRCGLGAPPIPPNAVHHQARRLSPSPFRHPKSHPLTARSFSWSDATSCASPGQCRRCFPGSARGWLSDRCRFARSREPLLVPISSPQPIELSVTHHPVPQAKPPRRDKASSWQIKFKGASEHHRRKQEKVFGNAHTIIDYASKSLACLLLAPFYPFCCARRLVLPS